MQDPRRADHVPRELQGSSLHERAADAVGVNAIPPTVPGGAGTPGTFEEELDGVVKIQRRATWYYDPRFGAWLHFPAGFFEEGVAPEPDVELKDEDSRSLVVALDEAGWIQPRLDTRLREEDLRITHRLLDVIETLTDQGGGTP